MSDPLTLLGGETRPMPVLSQYFNPMFCCFLGVFSAGFLNFVTKRPVFSGIQKHIILGGAGLVIGKVADDHRNETLAKRDAVLRHYIELHPEDFPVPERKKYKEVFNSWTPVR